MNILNERKMYLDKILADLEAQNNYRTLKNLNHSENFVFMDGRKLLNLAGNDYLSLAQNQALRDEFFVQLQKQNLYFSSSSSRSLSGNFSIYQVFEQYLAELISKNASREVLHFNSGYHLNISCIQALGSLPHTLFLADKFVHASIIDGLRLAQSKFLRFGHNDMLHLESMLQKYHKEYEHIIIISEALFSMDGDFALIQKLVEFKKTYKNILLYIDEAHSVGCFDESGLGFVKYLGYENAIDFLVFTFGKAIASMGACMITHKDFKSFFINKARAFIYSTALPPLNVAWTYFIFQKLKDLGDERERLWSLSAFLKSMLTQKGFDVVGEAHILCLLCYSNQKADELSKKLLECGIFAPAIKEPTVPKNSARIRFSLHAGLEMEQLEGLVQYL